MAEGEAEAAEVGRSRAEGWAVDVRGQGGYAAACT
jgi:hypothetical protein